MKKVKIFAFFAATVLLSGITAYSVTKATGTSTKEVVYSNQDGVPAHFTNYQKEEYPDLTYAAENAVKAVVSIDRLENVRGYSAGDQLDPFYEFFGIPQPQQRRGTPQSDLKPQKSGSGSGVIITPDGYIVSNNHVVEGAAELKVKLEDGRTFNAKIVGADPQTDIALLKIEAKDLPFLIMGDSEKLRLGEWVLAIGAPYELSSTITAGIVSAKARSLGVTGQTGIESFIQTDAAVNPGNSGGALVNTKGELVGINTVIKSPTGSYSGYSFAVPTTLVKKIVADIKEHGVVQRAMLGIMFTPISDDFIEQRGKETGIKEMGGLYIEEVVEGGSADAAGIKKGDVLIAVNDTKLDVSSKLQELIATQRPGDKIKVSIKRGAETKHFDVVLRNRAGKTELLKKDAVDARNDLGGEFGEISDKVKKEFKVKGGVRVLSIKQEGILASARVKSGYVITQINDTPIHSANDLNKIADKIEYLEGFYPDGRHIAYSVAK